MQGQQNIKNTEMQTKKVHNIVE